MSTCPGCGPPLHHPPPHHPCSGTRGEQTRDTETRGNWLALQRQSVKSRVLNPDPVGSGTFSRIRNYLFRSGSSKNERANSGKYLGTVPIVVQYHFPAVL